MPINNNNQNNHSQYGKITKSDIELLRGAGGAELLVFMTLSIHAWNDERIAFPTAKTIQEITGLSRGSVMRALSKLKDRSIINEIGKTRIGSIKYKLGCIRSDTCTRSDTRLKSDTCTRSDTPPSTRSDTPPVSDLIHIKLKEKEKTKEKTLASYEGEEKDILLFCVFWNKWNDTALCKWIADDAVQSYKQIRAAILSLWKSNNYNKDLFYELQVLDIFLMQKMVEIGKDYSGSARFWAGDKWIEGLRKWLSSSTKSHMGGNRKSFIPHVINITLPEADLNASKKDSQESPLTASKSGSYTASQKWFLDCFNGAIEAHQIHNDNMLLNQSYQWIYDNMIKTYCTNGIASIRELPQSKPFWHYIDNKGK